MRIGPHRGFAALAFEHQFDVPVVAQVETVVQFRLAAGGHLVEGHGVHGAVAEVEEAVFAAKRAGGVVAFEQHHLVGREAQIINKE